MRYENASFHRKKTIADSFKNLLLVKSFDKITITDIVKDCGINRKTFYYHFEDIYALLQWMLEQEAIDIVKNLDLTANYKEAIGFVLDYVDQNDKILNNICHSIGRDHLKQFFYLDFIEITRSLVDLAEKTEGHKIPEDFKAFLVRFYTEAIAGMLIQQIIEPSSDNHNELIEYYYLTLSSAIPGAINALKNNIPSAIILSPEEYERLSDIE
ncbi:MAG: TetR/AcrR family transcriptional regulator C-terminal domain-containing protein [Lachnospiraceae bacterium]|nr:TetR/AcrR family transcriptional regulator C-terminal domain-containing protein [Lachnospiraceae bacterium]